MGNCLNREFSSAVWAGDDWCSIDSEHQTDQDSSNSSSPSSNSDRQKLINDIKEMLTSSFSSSSSLSSHSAAKELRIRISKRQLEQLLDRAERLGLTAEQVIKRLMRAKERRRRKQQNTWSSNLHSIPEIY